MNFRNKVGKTAAIMLRTVWTTQHFKRNGQYDEMIYFLVKISYNLQTTATKTRTKFALTPDLLSFSYCLSAQRIIQDLLLALGDLT